MFLNVAFKNIKVQSLNIRLSLFTIKLYNLLSCIILLVIIQLFIKLISHNMIPYYNISINIQ